MQKFFNSTGEAMIHLVREDWLGNSLDLGGRFDEAKYQVPVWRHRPERKTALSCISSIPDATVLKTVNLTTWKAKSC